MPMLSTRRNDCWTLTLLTLFFLLILSWSIHGQFNFLHDTQDEFFALTFQKPDVEDRFQGFTRMSGMWTIHGEFRVGKRQKVVVNIPFVHAARREFTINETYTFSAEPAENLMANPYIGVVQIPVRSNFSASLGVYLPVTDDDKRQAIELGLLNGIDDLERFYTQHWSIPFRVQYLGDPGTAVRTTMGISPILVINTSEFGDALEVFLEYGFGLAYWGSRARFGADITGKAFMTEGNYSYSERSFHHVNVSTRLVFERWMPGLVIKFPLDDAFIEAVSAIYAFQVAYMLSD